MSLKLFDTTGKHAGRVWTREVEREGWAFNVTDVLYKMDDQKRYTIGRVRQDRGNNPLTPSGAWFGFLRFQICERVIWRQVAADRSTRPGAVLAVIRQWAKLLEESVVPEDIWGCASLREVDSK